MVEVKVLGGGKQGEKAASKLVDSIWMPNAENIQGGLSSRHNIESVEIVESDEQRASELDEEFADSETVEVVNQRAEDYLRESGAEGLIFDSTNTNERLNSVTEAVLENMEDPEELAYWSEKPASDKIRDIRDAGAKASMDLIENFSLQKQSVLEDIEEEDYEVRSISTWRTSKTAKQVQFEEEADEPLGEDPADIDWSEVTLEDFGLENRYDNKGELVDDIVDWRFSRNLFQENAGSVKDKGAHDWGNILLTLEASGNEEDIGIEESNYRVVEVEKDEDTVVAYTESGKEVEIPYDGDRRLNDGFADVRASAGDTEIHVVTSLAEWPEEVDDEMQRLYGEFEEGIEEELGEVNLIYGEEGQEEIRVEYLEAEDPDTGEKIEYLVSTGADMFTLKKTTGIEGGVSYELLTEGGTDFLASYLEEGIEVLEKQSQDQTVSVDAAVRTSELLEKAAEAGYKNRGEPIRVEAPEGTPLRAVLES
jgi:hypothetical protein